MKCGKWNVTRKLRRRQRVQLEILTLSKVLRIECLLLLKGDQAKGRSIQNPNKPKTQKHAKKKGTPNIPIRVSISLSSYRHSFHSLTHFLKLWLEVTSKSTESTGEKAVLRAYWQASNFKNSNGKAFQVLFIAGFACPCLLRPFQELLFRKIFHW